MVGGLCEGRIVDGGGPICHSSSHIFSFSFVAEHSQLLVVGVAVANIGFVGDVLQVDDEGVLCLAAVNGSRLQEGDIFEGGRSFPGDVQLVLLVDSCFFELILLGFFDAVCDIRPHHVLVEVNFDLSGIVGVVEARRCGADGPHGPVVLIEKSEIYLQFT